MPCFRVAVQHSLALSVDRCVVWCALLKQRTFVEYDLENFYTFSHLHATCARFH